MLSLNDLKEVFNFLIEDYKKINIEILQKQHLINLGKKFKHPRVKEEEEKLKPFLLKQIEIIIRMSNILKEINDRQLYKEEYSSMEEFINEKKLTDKYEKEVVFILFDISENKKEPIDFVNYFNYIMCFNDILK